MKETKKFIKPLYDRVLLEVLADAKVGNIFIHEDAQQSQRAKVVAVGPGKLNADTGEYTHMHVSVGDVVYVNSQFGNRVKLNRGDDTKYVLMKEDEILGLECDIEVSNG